MNSYAKTSPTESGENQQSCTIPANADFMTVVDMDEKESVTSIVIKLQGHPVYEFSTFQALTEFEMPILKWTYYARELVFNFDKDVNSGLKVYFGNHRYIDSAEKREEIYAEMYDDLNAEFKK